MPCEPYLGLPPLPSPPFPPPGPDRPLLHLSSPCPWPPALPFDLTVDPVCSRAPHLQDGTVNNLFDGVWEPLPSTLAVWGPQHRLSARAGIEGGARALTPSSLAVGPHQNSPLLSAAAEGRRRGQLQLFHIDSLLDREAAGAPGPGGGAAAAAQRRVQEAVALQQRSSTPKSAVPPARATLAPSGSPYVTDFSSAPSLPASSAGGAAAAEAVVLHQSPLGRPKLVPHQVRPASAPPACRGLSTGQSNPALPLLPAATSIGPCHLLQRGSGRG